LQPKKYSESAVEIYPKREEVKFINEKAIRNIKMNEKPYTSQIFRCKDHFNFKPEHRLNEPDLARYSTWSEDGRLLRELVRNDRTM
jgi:hypothetical protein